MLLPENFNTFVTLVHYEKHLKKTLSFHNAISCFRNKWTSLYDLAGFVFMEEIEIWKDIKGYEGFYQISTFGRVKSLERKHSENTRRYPERIRIIRNNKYGYSVIKLFKGTKIGINHTIHRLIAIAFINNPNNYPQVNHKNGIKNDNRIENLEWCTNSQNQLHSYRVLGNVNRMPKLNKNQIKEVVRLVNTGLSKRAVGRMFNVNVTMICNITNKTKRCYQQNE